MAQNKVITFRISETLQARFKRALGEKGIDQTTFLLSKINEFCDEVERNQTIKEDMIMTKVEAYFSEWEDQHEIGGDEVTGCITYPVTITTESSTSSYGQPVVIIDGEAHGPGDMPHGELQIPSGVYDEISPLLKQLGYAVCSSPVNNDWLNNWEDGIRLDERHWHPEARLVSF